MKSCPTCNRTYPDDTLAFCLMDGSVLSAPYDESGTQRTRVIWQNNPPQTEVLGTPKVPVETGPPPEPTIPAPAPLVSPLRSNKKTGSSQKKQSRVPEPFRWALMLRGLAAIAFGAAVFIWPVHNLNVLELLFVSYALFGSTLTVVFGITAYSKYKAGWMMLVEGIFGVLAGVIMLAALKDSRAVLVWMEAWSLGAGAFQMGAAIELRKYLSRTWLLLLAGAASLLYGFVLLMTKNIYSFMPFFAPMAGWALAVGGLILTFGLTVRTKKDSPHR